MLKRLAEQIEEMKATESPQNRQTFTQSSPKKEYPFNIIVRKIIDPESKELLAVTLENTYPVLNWIKGEEPIHDLYISAQGKFRQNSKYLLSPCSNVNRSFCAKT